MLRKMREDRGWSQTKMAEESRLGRKAISFIEEGQRQPKLDTLIRMSVALETPLSDLLKEAGW
jgi:transcriptional regulator with XRE-family HTH domain